jgi:hypothetical protein
MGACQPSGEGYLERDGVKVFYELFGAGEPTMLPLPTWSIIQRTCVSAMPVRSRDAGRERREPSGADQGPVHATAQVRWGGPQAGCSGTVGLSVPYHPGWQPGQAEIAARRRRWPKVRPKARPL